MAQKEADLTPEDRLLELDVGEASPFWQMIRRKVEVLAADEATAALDSRMPEQERLERIHNYEAYNRLLELPKEIRKDLQGEGDAVGT